MGKDTKFCRNCGKKEKTDYYCRCIGNRFAHCNCGDCNFEQHDFWRQIR